MFNLDVLVDQLNSLLMQNELLENENTQLKEELSGNIISQLLYATGIRKESNSAYGICKYNTDTGKLVQVYELIPTIEETLLLSQLAMGNKDHFTELILILPGYNRDIKANSPAEYEEALALAEKYAVRRGAK